MTNTQCIYKLYELLHKNNTNTLPLTQYYSGLSEFSTERSPVNFIRPCYFLLRWCTSHSCMNSLCYDVALYESYVTFELEITNYVVACVLYALCLVFISLFYFWNNSVNLILLVLNQYHLECRYFHGNYCNDLDF